MTEKQWAELPPAWRQILEWAALEADDRWGGDWGSPDLRAKRLAESPVEAEALALLRAVLPPSMGFTA